jgi:hypothetical protein
VKTQRKHVGLETVREKHPPVGRRAKNQAPTSKLGKLYSRLDQTKPGSKASKQIADEIIDAIG